MPRPHQSPLRRAVAPGRTGPAETVPEAQDPSAPARRRPPWSSSPGASSSPRRGAFVPRAGALVPANFAVAISSALFSLTRRGTEGLSFVVQQPTLAPSRAEQRRCLLNLTCSDGASLLPPVLASSPTWHPRLSVHGVEVEHRLVPSLLQ